ncbi:MAG TPA: hypothetical protein VGE39_11295 [Prosthecobacter sp.]
MDSRLIIRTSSAVALIIALWFAWWAFGRSPESQIRAAQAALLEAVEDRDWDDVADFLSADYSDSYGHTRQSAIDDGKKYLGLFYALSIKTDQISVRAAKEQGVLQSMLRMEGNGAGYSQAVMGAVNQIQEPWIFHWTKTGLWPWTWQVTMIHNDQIR